MGFVDDETYKLEVQTPATAWAFTTIADVKAELGISSTGDDSILTNFVDEVSALIPEITGRVFAKEVVQEGVAGAGGTDLLLSRRPIVDIASLTYNNNPVTNYVIKDSDAGIVHREGFWTAEGMGDWFLTRVSKSGDRVINFIFTYTGGYEMADSTETVTLPASLQRIAKDAVKMLYKSKGADPSLKKKHLDDMTEEYETRDVRSFLEARLNDWISVDGH